MGTTESKPKRHSSERDVMKLESIASGITAPLGFRAAGVACGIKPSGLDLALIEPEERASAAGLFTTNQTTAAPVHVCREHLAHTAGTASAIVVNSGCANACTGERGLVVARAMAAETADRIGCATTDVLVASTGVIGVDLDPGKVARGIATAAAELDRNGHLVAAQAILTTDAGPKEAAVRVTTPAGTFHVGGMAKGAGMIEPMLATMLAFLTTDADVEAGMLHRALEDATADTFNAITVDGECSTNDTVLALAGGRSGVVINEVLYPTFVEALRRVARELALAIVRGGEGATKLIAVRVAGAASTADAQRTARVIANSLLVKTAIHGGDPNWGRLVAAAGRAGVAFDAHRTTIRIGQTVLFEHGRPFDDRAPTAAAYLHGDEVEVGVDLGLGTGTATVWTCDLSADYVKINSEYRT